MTKNSLIFQFSGTREELSTRRKKTLGLGQKHSQQTVTHIIYDVDSLNKHIADIKQRFDEKDCFFKAGVDSASARHYLNVPYAESKSENGVAYDEFQFMKVPTRTSCERMVYGLKESLKHTDYLHLITVTQNTKNYTLKVNKQGVLKAADPTPEVIKASAAGWCNGRIMREDDIPADVSPIISAYMHAMSHHHNRLTQAIDIYKYSSSQITVMDRTSCNGIPLQFIRFDTYGNTRKITEKAEKMGFDPADALTREAYYKTLLKHDFDKTQRFVYA